MEIMTKFQFYLFLKDKHIVVNVFFLKWLFLDKYSFAWFAFICVYMLLPSWTDMEPVDMFWEVFLHSDSLMLQWAPIVIKREFLMLSFRALTCRKCCFEFPCGNTMIMCWMEFWSTLLSVKSCKLIMFFVGVLVLSLSFPFKWFYSVLRGRMFLRRRGDMVERAKGIRFVITF